MINFFSRKPLTPLADQYKSKTARRFQKSTPAAEIPFVVLDTETTGFHVGTDRMLSIAYLPVKTDAIQPSRMKTGLFYRERPVINEAMKIHGILPSETASGTDARQIIAGLLEDLAGTVIVGHHIQFDARMLDEAFYRLFGVHFKNQLIDTAALATEEIEAFHRTGYANQRPPSLDDVCRHLRLSMADRHTAAGDTYITAEIFVYLCAKRQKRLGYPLKLADLPVTKLK